MGGNDNIFPACIYSIQFLEFNPGFDVINQDSSYVRDVEFVDGTVFGYNSVAASGTVTRGMNIVLRGVNEAGEPLRKVFTIAYTHTCDVDTFRRGDAIRWVVLVSFGAVEIKPFPFFSGIAGDV